MPNSKTSKKVKSLEEIEEETDTPSEVGDSNTKGGSANEVNKAKNKENSRDENEGSESSDDENDKGSVSVSSDEESSRLRRYLNAIKNSNCRCVDREMFLKMLIPLVSVVVTLAAIMVLFLFEDDIHEIYELDEQNEQKPLYQERYPLL